MSKLYIWNCTVDLDSHTKEERVYYPNYGHIDSYVVVAETATEALYNLKARMYMSHVDNRDTEDTISRRIDDNQLPLTDEEHEASRKRYSSGIYPVRWNWVAEQVTPYIGDKYENGSVLCYSWNAP